MGQNGDDAKNFGGDRKNGAAALLSASDAPRHQGFSVVKYLSAAAMTNHMDSRARENSNLSYCARTSRWRLLNFGEVFVPRRKLRGLRDFSIKVLTNHGGGTAGEIAKAVGEIAVIAGDKGFAAEIAVATKNGFAQQVITKRVHAEHVDDGLRG